MAMRIASLSERYDAWLVSIAPLATIAANLPADAKVQGLTDTHALRQIEQFSLGIGVSAELKLNAELVMTNAKSAGSLAEAIQMLLGMMQKNAKEDPGIMAALQNLNFGVDQNRVHIGFTMPGDEVEKALAKAFTPESKKTGPMTAARRPLPAVPAPPAESAPSAPEPTATVATPEPAAAEPAPSAPTAEPAVAAATPAVKPSPAAEPTTVAATEPAAVSTAGEPAPEATASAPAPAEPSAPPAVQAAAVPAPAPVPAPAAPPMVRKAPGPVTRSPRIPANGDLLIQSSPKDMGTVVIIGSKK
jgi:hypothetical protein